MVQTTLRLPEELKRKIDEDRAEKVMEGDGIPSRSEWLREAAREKLGIDYVPEDDGSNEVEA